MPGQSSAKSNFAPAALWGCGSLSLLGYLVLLGLSHQFGYETEQNDRPLFLTVSLFAVLSVVYLFAIRFAVQVKQPVIRCVVGFAVAFRAVMLFSEPIQEVDIYRYLWDGVVSAQGVSPFAYAPQVVADALPAAGLPASGLPSELDRLVAQVDRSPGIEETLQRVHFAFLPTVYPPVSQLVFASVAMLTPEDASADTRVFGMKATLLLFDLATIYAVFLTLRHTGMSEGWLVAYAWCPLVLKEFANSGHLDSIAVCLSAFAVYCTMLGLFPRDNQKLSQSRVMTGAALLGAAVGAKLYPVALVPILAWSAVHRLGWGKTFCVAVVFLLSVVVCLGPMFWLPAESVEVTMEPALPDAENPFVPVEEDADPSAGLKAFLSQWMMNDVIFLSISENMTPDSLRQGQATPWFVLLPESVRRGLVDLVSQAFDLESGEVHSVPFLTARIATAVAFVFLAVVFARQAARTDSAERWLECVFLTLAWFWLLLPTLNPWYWIWALPWVAFARNRVWLGLSGVLFIYYLRFHFEANPELQWGPYFGASIFDFGVVWLEYVPWFALLTGWHLWARPRTGK